MGLSGFALIGRPFAIWPPTLQVMPAGIADAGFGRLLVGVRISNGSIQDWSATEVRISPRGRRILAKANIVASDNWSSADGSALGQTALGEWIAVAPLPAGAVQTVFLKLDFTDATSGLHFLELELRDPAAPGTTLKAGASLPVVRTTWHRGSRTATSVCDRGTLTASLSAVTLDQEIFRQVLGKARLLSTSATPGTRTPADTERLRHRLRALLCGEDSDICGALSDLNSTCALPVATTPGSSSGVGSTAVAILSDQASNLGNSVRVTDGSVFSNHAVNVGNDAIIAGAVISGGDIQIGDRTLVQANVTAAGLIKTSPSGGAVIVGTANQHASVAPLTIPTKTVSQGSANTTVNSGTGTLANPYVLAPGKYGTFTINSGNVISLSAGTYHFGQLLINADVTLILNSPVASIDVRVQTNLSFGDRLIVKPGTSEGVAQFYSNQTSEVRVGTDIPIFPFALTAPQGTIHVFSRTNVMGQLAAKIVTLEPDVTVGCVSLDPAVASWVGSGASGLEFLGYPTVLDYKVAYHGGYFGSTGPLAFDLVSWKALLANAVLKFQLGLTGAVSSELLSIADQAVVGAVKAAVLNAPTTAPGSAPTSTQAGSVDAAVASVRGNRSLGSPLFTQLDAAVDESNSAPINGAVGTFSTSGFLTNAELDAAIASGTEANLRVHKSGAGTGVTHGLISALVPVLARDDQTGTLYFVNQLLIVPDPLMPAADGQPASFGDSGAVWVQSSSKKVVGLSHTVGTSGVVASRIQDVGNALQIQLI